MLFPMEPSPCQMHAQAPQGPTGVLKGVQSPSHRRESRAQRGSNLCKDGAASEHRAAKAGPARPRGLGLSHHHVATMEGSPAQGLPPAVRACGQDPGTGHLAREAEGDRRVSPALGAGSSWAWGGLRGAAGPALAPGARDAPALACHLRLL